MNLINEIGKFRSKAEKDKLVKHIGTDAQRFAVLVNVLVQGPSRVTERAAWLLSYCVENHPTLVKTHLKTLVPLLSKPDASDAVKRNLLRMMQFISLPKAQQGKVIDCCFTFLSNPKERIAVRVFAMTVLGRLANEIPELANELIPLIEDQMPYGSAGFNSRGRKILTEFKS